MWKEEWGNVAWLVDYGLKKFQMSFIYIARLKEQP
jgi:hypothetical protein